MPRANTFGRQPARDLLWLARWPLSAVAQELGLTEAQVRLAVLGKTAPSPTLRKGLCRILGKPLEELFTPDALTAKYDATKNPWKSVNR